MSLQIGLFLLFAIIVSFSSLLAKVALNKKNNSIAFTVIHNLAGGLLILPLIWLDHRLPANPSSWLFLAIGTITSIAGDYFYFKSFGLEDVSTIILVLRFRTVLVFLLGSLMFGEALTINRVVVMMLVTFGSLITAYNKQKITISRGMIYAVVAGLFLAVMTVVDKKVASEISVPIYNVINFLSSGLFFAWLYLRGKSGGIIEIFGSFKRDVWLMPAIGAGVLLSVSSMCRRYGLTMGEITYAAPFLNMSLIFTTLMGIFWLKETKQIPQKIIGVMFILLGLMIQK